MPEWMLDTCPPTVSRKGWHAMTTGQRRAAVKGYWHGLRLDTRHMLRLKNSARPRSGPQAYREGGV